MAVIASNPIMSGFYPDPSICAVGEDFYLVNSSFAYFPGLPIMHSKDLAHWEQIGNALNRNSQLPLKNAEHSGGLFAPTIRYHEGTFYMICTNVSGGGNFIVTAKNPDGPWSEPYYISGADGIDPSLFFDEDGSCYYIGTHPNPEGCKYGGDWYIWIQQLDMEKIELVGEKKDVWNGAMKNIIWPEGPHLYKKDGMYYIMHAEGGTGPDHAVTICRSESIWGPYENNFCNPILTHRHLGKEYPIKYVGHGDMVETVAGEWFMVMLAVRPMEGYTTMGRETFLAKVIWENGWPVVNPGVGILTEQVEIKLPEWIPDQKGTTSFPGTDKDYDFTRMECLGEEFLQLRNPKENSYQLANGVGLLLSFGESDLKELTSPSYVAIRQQHHFFDAEVTLNISNLTDGRCAGLAMVQSNEYYMLVKVQEQKAILLLCENKEDKIQGELEIEGEEVILQFQVRGLAVSVNVISKESVAATSQKLGEVDVRKLSTEIAGGFVGCTLGMYAMKDESKISENGNEYACFQRFIYKSVNLE